MDANISDISINDQHDNLTKNNHDETSTEVTGKQYIATLALDSNTLAEVVIFESFTQLDGSVGTPFLLVTEELEGGTVETQILIDGIEKEVLEVPSSLDVVCETEKVIEKDSSEQNAVLDGDMTPLPNQSDQFSISPEEKHSPKSPHKQRFLKCDFEGCYRTFMWPAHLKYHSLTHTGSRQFKCPFKDCDRCFYTQQRLDVHLRTHTGERPFTCDVSGCDKGFTTAGNLKNHMRIHTGEKPFVCEIKECGKSFAELSSLKKHCLVHTGDKPFACEFCGKAFSQLGSRNVHHRRHHGNSENVTTVAASISDSSLHVLQNDNLSEILQDNEQTTISFHQGVQLVEFSKDEVNFDIAEAIVIPATISTNPVINADAQQARKLSETCNETRTGESESIEPISSVGNLSYSVILPHSNANVLVLAQPQSIPELGYHLPPTHMSEEITYKSILP